MKRTDFCDVFSRHSIPLFRSVPHLLRGGALPFSGSRRVTRFDDDNLRREPKEPPGGMFSATEWRDHFAEADLCGKYLQGASRPVDPPLMDWMTARCVDSVPHFSHARVVYRRASDRAPIPLKGHPVSPSPAYPAQRISAIRGTGARFLPRIPRAAG